MGHARVGFKAKTSRLLTFAVPRPIEDGPGASGKGQERMAEAPAMGSRRRVARAVAGVPIVIALLIAGAGVALTIGLVDSYGANLGPRAELLVLAVLQAA